MIQRLFLFFAGIMIKWGCRLGEVSLSFHRRSP